MGLKDESYCSIRSQILALDPLPPLERILNITKQEKNHKKVMIARDNRSEAATTFAVKESPMVDVTPKLLIT